MERMYEIIKQPLVTEKTTMLAEQNKLTFEVAKDATKTEVKQAVEKLFNVSVEKVNILNQQGKTKRFRGHMGKRSDVKKAFVTLKEGQEIDLTSGL